MTLRRRLFVAQLGVDILKERRLTETETGCSEQAISRLAERTAPVVECL